MAIKNEYVRCRRGGSDVKESASEGGGIWGDI
jgi:hypothetical protein